MHLRNWIAGVVVVWVSITGGIVFAQNVLQDAIVKAGLKMEDVRAETTFYYQNPQPDKMMAVLRVLVTVKEFTSDTKRFPVISRIFVVAAYKDKIVLEKMKLLKDSLSGDTKTIVENLIKEEQGFTSPEADSNEHIDDLWAEFFATGQAEPIKKIMSVLGVPAENLEQKTLLSNANWSLASNVKQHKKVYEIIKEESSNATGLVKEMLDQMIKDADKK